MVRLDQDVFMDGISDTFLRLNLEPPRALTYIIERYDYYHSL
jgi:hypothetical protein